MGIKPVTKIGIFAVIFVTFRPGSKYDPITFSCFLSSILFNQVVLDSYWHHWIKATVHERQGVSNHRLSDCLFDYLFGLIKETSKLRIGGSYGLDQGPVQNILKVWRKQMQIMKCNWYRAIELNYSQC